MNNYSAEALFDSETRMRVHVMLSSSSLGTHSAITVSTLDAYRLFTVWAGLSQSSSGT